MINLNQLRAFYQVAKCQNVSIAAKNLFVSQPAVTAQVKLFEDNCGLKLFKKKGRNLHLTDEGMALYKYARKIFEYEKKIESTVEQMQELKQGILRLGSARTYARYFMPFLLTGFREAYPNVKIHLDQGSSLDMIHSLRELKNEVVIVAKAEENPDICFIPFSREEVVLLLAPDHHLARKKSVDLGQVAEEPIILKDQGSGTRRLIDKLFIQNNHTPNFLMETGDAEIIKLLVQHGEGVSFLVREAVAVELQAGKLATVPIKDQKIFLDVSIAYLKNQPLSPPAQAFLTSMENLGTKEMRFRGLGALMEQQLQRR